ncbi:hypothetical protein JXI42_07315 [bacterium]|nr:hypothetical protein [bacterium]
MEKLHGDAKYFQPNFWKVCRPRLCPNCPYEGMCVAASKMARDVEFIDGFMLINGFYYYDKHLWFDLGRDDTLRMGLDDFGKKILGEITGIELPEKSKSVDAGEVLLRIICGDRDLKLRSPIAGEVKRTNSKLEKDISLINEDPYEQWMIRFAPADLEENLKGFYYGEEAQKWLERDVDRLRYRVESEVGVTVADGGAFVQTVDKIDESEWENLVKEFLPV